MSLRQDFGDRCDAAKVWVMKTTQAARSEPMPCRRKMMGTVVKGAALAIVTLAGFGQNAAHAMHIAAPSGALEHIPMDTNVSSCCSIFKYVLAVSSGGEGRVHVTPVDCSYMRHIIMAEVH